MKKVLCLVVVLLFAVSIMVYALPVKPDVPLTCSCGGTNVYMGTSVGDWSAPIGQRTCVHGHGGYDFKCYRDVTDYYECSLCGKSLTSSYKEYDWLCGSELLPLSIQAATLSEGRAEQCDACGTTMSPYKVDYSAWEGPIDIRQTPNGYMYLFIRDVNSFYQCPACGTHEVTTYTERMWTDKNM